MAVYFLFFIYPKCCSVGFDEDTQRRAWSIDCIQEMDKAAVMSAVSVLSCVLLQTSEKDLFLHTCKTRSALTMTAFQILMRNFTQLLTFSNIYIWIVQLLEAEVTIF